MTVSGHQQEWQQETQVKTMGYEVNDRTSKDCHCTTFAQSKAKTEYI